MAILFHHFRQSLPFKPLKIYGDKKNKPIDVSHFQARKSSVIY